MKEMSLIAAGYIDKVCIGCIRDNYTPAVYTYILCVGPHRTFNSQVYNMFYALLYLWSVSTFFLHFCLETRFLLVL